MSNWVFLEMGAVNKKWEEDLKEYHLLRTDKTDAEWVDLDSGCSIALVSDGGWREAQYDEERPSRYRAFHRGPGGLVEEVTRPLVGENGEFDRSKEGSSTYTSVRDRLVTTITNLLHARKSREIWSSQKFT